MPNKVSLITFKVSVTTLLLASGLSATPRHRERYVEGTFPLKVNQTCKLNLGRSGLFCDRTFLCSPSQISAMKSGEVIPHHFYFTIYTNFDTNGTFELGKDDGGIVVVLTLATNVVLTDYDGRILFPKDKAPTLGPLERRKNDVPQGHNLGALCFSVSFFRINTCKSVSKQRTLTIFRMNTYAKRGEGVWPLARSKSGSGIISKLPVTKVVAIAKAPSPQWPQSSSHLTQRPGKTQETQGRA